MALIKCSNCGQQVSDRANVCIHCGFSIEQLNSKQELEKILEEKLQEEREKLQKEQEILHQNFNEELNKKELEKQQIANERENLLEELNGEIEKRKKDDKEKEKLKMELENIKNINNRLENKLSNRRNENIKNTASIIKKIIFGGINSIRYFFGIMFTIGAIISLIDNDFVFSLQLLIFSITLYPFIYKLIWKKANISTTTKIIIQIVVPIITLIVLAIALGGK